MNAGKGNSGQAVTGQSMVRSTQDQPKDYLMGAILVTIFCCIPFGIVAILKSMEVRRRIDSGDTDGAVESSKAAKKWIIIAVTVGSVIFTISVIVRVAQAIAAGNT